MTGWVQNIWGIMFLIVPPKDGFAHLTNSHQFYVDCILIRTIQHIHKQLGKFEYN